MRVYRPSMVFGPDSNSVYQVPVHAEGEEWPDSIHDAKPIGAKWKPFRLEIEAGQGRRPTGDFTMVSCSVPAVSERAAIALADLFSQHAELLPLVGPGEQKWFALNVRSLAEGVLDEQNCEVSRFNDGSIMEIWRYAFHRERMAATPPIFKLAERPRGDILVTDAFVEQVRRHELIGFGLELLWEG